MASLDALENLGLSKTEVRVYLALLKLGTASGSEIAEKAGIFRRNAYDALKKLSGKGLVNSIQGDKSYYSAVSPGELRFVLKEKENSLEELMPELLKLYSGSKERQKALLFEGEGGTKAILNEVLKEKKEWLAFISSGQSRQVLGDWGHYWERKRAMAGIKAKLIFSNTSEGKKLAEDIEKSGLAEVKILESINVVNPTATYVFGNKVAIMLWSKTNPIGVLVESNEIADANRKYFELLWKIAKKH